MTDEPKPEAGEPQEPAVDVEPEIYDLEPVDAAAGGTGVSPVGSDSPPEEDGKASGHTAPPAGPKSRIGEPTYTATAMARTPDAPFTRGIGGIRAAMITSAVLLLLALIMTGVRAGDTQLTALMLTLSGSFLTIVVNGALGTLAVIAAARCVGTRVAEPELFALRMLAAAAAFGLLYQTGTPIPTRIDDFLLGLAGYATIVWLLFRLPPRETGLVILWHAGLVALLALNTFVDTRITAQADPGNGQTTLEEPVRETIPSID